MFIISILQIWKARPEKIKPLTVARPEHGKAHSLHLIVCSLLPFFGVSHFQAECVTLPSSSVSWWAVLKWLTLSVEPVPMCTREPVLSTLTSTCYMLHSLSNSTSPLFSVHCSGLRKCTVELELVKILTQPLPKKYDLWPFFAWDSPSVK
jgi:hypothetical protein